MKFYYVYILHNAQKKFIYSGYSEDVRKRFEAYNNMKDAKRREEYFKTTKGKTMLKLMLKEYFFAME